MYDAIIVGARCAGAPLAMLLSRKGHRVLLVDKASFPSDRISTHFIMQAGLARAKGWGLLPKICALGAPLIRRGHMDADDGEFSGYPPPMDGIDYAVAPRRTRLDQLLVDEAVSAGVEFREGLYVEGVLTEADRVTGVRGHSPRGTLVTERATIVVGADGPASVVARTVGAGKYQERLSSGGAYYAYWDGVPQGRDFEMYVRPGYGGVRFPTNEGLTCIVGGWSEEAFGRRCSPAEGYRAYLQAIPRLAEVLIAAKQVEPLKGMQALHGYFRQSWGPGWALAGDAGYHKHPISAQGISDAFREPIRWLKRSTPVSRDEQKWTRRCRSISRIAMRPSCRCIRVRVSGPSCSHSRLRSAPCSGHCGKTRKLPTGFSASTQGPFRFRSFSRLTI